MATELKGAIIRESFHGKSLDFLLVNGRLAFTAKTLGLALDYEFPDNSILRIYHRHEHLFENNIDKGEVKLTSPGGIQNTIVFYWTGVIILLMKSEQPLADEFIKWAKHILADLITGETILTKNQSPSAPAAQPTNISAQEYIAVLKENRHLLQDKIHCLQNHQSPSIPAPKPNSVACSIAEQRKLMLARYGMTQREFAKRNGFSISLVNKWINDETTSRRVAFAFDQLTAGKVYEPSSIMTYAHQDQTETQIELSISDQRKLMVSHLGITQRELADRIGVTKQAISEWMLGGNSSRHISTAIEKLTAELAQRNGGANC